MNSLYGLYGSSTGYMPCKAVAASTTATGRAMIDKTKEVVEAMGGTVLYGDTVSIWYAGVLRRRGMQTAQVCECAQDSVFVRWENGTTMEQAFSRGEEYAAAVTRHFLPPIKLEMEKVIFPLLLFKKKRYVLGEMQQPSRFRCTYTLNPKPHARVQVLWVPVRHVGAGGGEIRRKGAPPITPSAVAFSRPAGARPPRGFHSAPSVP